MSRRPRSARWCARNIVVPSTRRSLACSPPSIAHDGHVRSTAQRCLESSRRQGGARQERRTTTGTAGRCPYLHERAVGTAASAANPSPAVRPAHPGSVNGAIARTGQTSNTRITPAPPRHQSSVRGRRAAHEKATLHTRPSNSPPAFLLPPPLPFHHRAAPCRSRSQVQSSIDLFAPSFSHEVLKHSPWSRPAGIWSTVNGLPGPGASPVTSVAFFPTRPILVAAPHHHTEPATSRSLRGSNRPCLLGEEGVPVPNKTDDGPFPSHVPAGGQSRSEPRARSDR